MLSSIVNDGIGEVLYLLRKYLTSIKSTKRDTLTDVFMHIKSINC